MAKHPGGRPLLFKSVEELEAEIQSYFKDCDPHPELHTRFEYHKQKVNRTRIVNGKKKTYEEEIDDHSKEPFEVKQWRVSEPIPYTVTGLANYLNTSRETLINYESREEFFDTIKRAKDIIEHQWEIKLLGNNVTGVIFNLKNNYQWKDKSEQELTNPDGSLSPFKELTPAQLRKLASK